MAPGISPSAREAWRKGRAPTAKNIWQRTSTTRHRLGLMREMQRLGLGFNSDEAYVKNLVGQGKIQRSQGGIEEGILSLALEAKIGDQRGSLQELKAQQGRVRGEVATTFGGGTMAYRRVLRKLKRVGKAEDRVQGSRLGAKLDHLRIKHSKSLKERRNTTSTYKPKWKDKYPISISISLRTRTNLRNYFRK